MKVTDPATEISIHALFAEGDVSNARPRPMIQPFLSTPSSQRATRHTALRPLASVFLSTPSSQRATYTSWSISPWREFLSTPSSQRATKDVDKFFLRMGFLSTPSSQRATPAAAQLLQIVDISIHALFAEGDRPRGRSAPGIRDFYPRPLRRGRPKMMMTMKMMTIFLSTPSSQRATSILARGLTFSIPFLSTPSSQRATNRRVAYFKDYTISIHALFAEGDMALRLKVVPQDISIHALFAEGDLSLIHI